MPEQDLQNAIEDLALQQKELLSKQQDIVDQLGGLGARQTKDRWDILAAMAPIISGAIIAMCGAYFTTIYNQQQLKLQEIQTIEKFIPHLTSDEKSKRAAILAISSLTDARLAAKVAAIYASEGTVSALQSIAEHGSSGDRTIASNALPKTLDNMAENYRVEKRYEDAVNTYKKALALRQNFYGSQSSRLVPSLARLADLYISHNEFAEAEALLQRSVLIQKSNYGRDSVQVASALRSLADLYREQGRLAKAEFTLNQAIAIEQKLPATTGDDKSQVASDIPEEDQPMDQKDKKVNEEPRPRAEAHADAPAAAEVPVRESPIEAARSNERHQSTDNNKPADTAEPSKAKQLQPAAENSSSSSSGESSGAEAHSLEGRGKTI